MSVCNILKEYTCTLDELTKAAINVDVLKLFDELSIHIPTKNERHLTVHDIPSKTQNEEIRVDDIRIKIDDTYELEDYERTYRAGRDAYTKSVGKLVIATQDYNAAQTGYVTSQHTYINAVQTLDASELILIGVEQFKKDIDTVYLETYKSAKNKFLKARATYNVDIGKYNSSRDSYIATASAYINSLPNTETLFFPDLRILWGGERP